jgi:hypothetical protein
MAACAVAAAVSLVPAAAQAAPSISMPTAPVTQVLHELNLGPASIADTSWFILFGPINHHSPKPHFDLPSFQVPILSQILVFLHLNNTELCLGGPSIKIGPYGGISIGIGLGC